MDAEDLEDYKDDPYAVLGVSTTATDADIKKAYRKLALKHHPDRQKPGSKGKDKAATQFAKISMAYEVLTDPNLRKEYDRLSGVRGGGGGGTSGSSGGNGPGTGASSSSAGSSNAASPHPPRKGGVAAAFGITGKEKGTTRKAPVGFRPAFHDPYDIWKRDFKDQFGFEYPGAEYDFTEDEPPKKALPPSSPPASPTKKNMSKDTPPKLSNSTDIVKHDKNAHAIVPSSPGAKGGRNNRPVAMEVKTVKDGPITTTITTFKRADGSTETCVQRSGIPGKKPEPNNRKMLEGPKQRKLLTNGGAPPPKSPSKKTTKLLANESHTESPRRGIRGMFGRSKQ